ncbi:MAG: ABC transporter permease [Solirubrobacteraceae bacterium]|nr:MAG: hypothetical protein DLM63_07165 [Solirubrobacterales bacterium]
MIEDVITIASYALREGLRRRVFVVVLALSLAFGVLYTAGSIAAFHATRDFSGRAAPVDARALTGATLLGLAMFSTLFLGAVLAIFLCGSTVRGDAERGLLAPLVVRPLGRSAVLVGRFVAGAGVCSAYVLIVFGGAVLVTHQAGGWWPDQIVLPAGELVLAVVVICAIALLGSVYFAAIANGILVFMVFGVGLTAGLLGQIGSGLGNATLTTIAREIAYVVPFEALYEAGLRGLTADQTGLTGLVVKLGPFGGGQSAGAALGPWTFAYLLLVLAGAARGFARRDL